MDENTRTTGDEAPNMLGRRLGIECRVWARDNRAIPPQHRAAIEERMPGLIGHETIDISLYHLFLRQTKSRSRRVS